MMAEAIGLLNAANYHGEKAVDAYRSGDEDLYCRHIAIAGRLWAKLASTPHPETAVSP